MEGGTGLLKAHTMPQTALDKRTQDIIDLCNHIIPYFHNTKFRRYIEDYKKYLGYKGDRQLLIKDWQTNIFIPLVATYADTMYNSLYDSKMKFHINNGIEGMETILNLAFDKDNNGRRNLLDAAREAIITGKGFIKPYLDMEERNIVIKGKEYGKTKKSPQITYVSIFNVFYDYNGTIEESPFIMERFILSEASIKKRYSSYIKSKEGEDALKRVLALPQCRFSDYDYNRVKNILSYEEDIVMNKRNTYLGPTNSIWDRQRLEGTFTGLGDTTNVETTNNIFAVDFKKNKKYEVIEYRDENSLTVIIDGKKFFYTQQTNFLGRVYDISFGRIPGTSDSTGIASNIGDIQSTINTLQNIFLDGLKMDAAPMYEQVGGLNQMLGNKNTIEYTPYGVISTNTAGALKKIEMGTGGFEPINANQALEGIAEKRVGVNEYITGGQGKVERVSGGVDLIYNQYKSRLMPITDSINQVMASVAKEFLVMYMMYFTSDELKALGLKGEYTIEQIINEEGVSFTLTALALLEKEELFAHLLDNMNAFVGFINGPTGQNINTKEFVRAILTKEVDMDKLLDTSEEDAKMKQMNQAQYQGGGQYQSQGQSQYQGGGLSAMAQNARY